MVETIKVKGKSGGNYVLFMDKDNTPKMKYPVIRRGKLMYGQTKTKSITQELYQKAVEYSKQSN